MLQIKVAQVSEFALHQASDSQFGQVDRGSAYSEGGGGFPSGVSLQDVEMVNLIVRWIDFAFDPAERGPKKVLPPFRFPKAFQRIGSGNGLVRQCADGSGLIMVRGRGCERLKVEAGTRAFPKLIRNFPAGHCQEPPLEGILARSVSELWHSARGCDYDFLNDFLGFALSETRLEGGDVEQAPVPLEEFAPTVLIRAVLEASEQAGAGGDGGRIVHWRMVFSKETVGSEAILAKIGGQRGLKLFCKKRRGRCGFWVNRKV